MDVREIVSRDLEVGLTLEFLSNKILENFMQNEFRISRKNAPCFAKFRVIAKLALQCQSQFRMFRISRNKTVNKHNETKLQRQMKRHCSFQIKFSSVLLSDILEPNLHPSSLESVLSCIPHFLHTSCIPPFHFRYFPVSLLSRIPL